MLSNYIECEPSEIALRYGAYGKPRLAQPSALHFSVSHDSDRTVLAISLSLVGIDTQCDHDIPFSPAVMPATGKHAWLFAAGHGPSFVERWTCFEAFTKAVGCGLAHDHVDFAVTWDHRGRPVLAAASNDDAGQWSLYTQRLSEGQIVTVAVRQPAAVLQLLDAGAELGWGG